MTSKVNQAPDQLIDEENIEKGSVKWSVYYQYLKAVSWSSLVILFLILMQVTDVASSFWLANWSQDKVNETSQHFCQPFTQRRKTDCVWNPGVRLHPSFCSWDQ